MTDSKDNDSAVAAGHGFPETTVEWLRAALDKEYDSLLKRLSDAEQREAGMRAALTEVRRAIVTADPEVLICTLWMPDDHPNETVVDFSDNALAPLAAKDDTRHKGEGNTPMQKEDYDGSCQ